MCAHMGNIARDMFAKKCLVRPANPPQVEPGLIICREEVWLYYACQARLRPFCGLRSFFLLPFTPVEGLFLTSIVMTFSVNLLPLGSLISARTFVALFPTTAISPAQRITGW